MHALEAPETSLSHYRLISAGTKLPILAARGVKLEMDFDRLEALRRLDTVGARLPATQGQSSEALLGALSDCLAGTLGGGPL